MELAKLIEIARGAAQADLLLANARIVEVFSGEIISGHIAVAGAYIAGIGDYQAERVIDLQNLLVAPGFIDSHVHIESSMTCVSEFSRAILPRGTTCVIADPHEIANVLGTNGIQYMLSSCAGQPLDIFYALPSCVPATDMETSGAILTTKDLKPFIDHKRVVALAEMMNFPGVIYGDPEILHKIDMTKTARKPIDGHAPGLADTELNAYVFTGIASDHECTSAEEALSKIKAGMHIMVREGTTARNLQALMPAIKASTARRMMWCTDDRHPHTLEDEGHIDAIVRSAIQAGLEPVTAIQMASINPAEYFQLYDRGAIAPGRLADLVVFSDFNALDIKKVYRRGRLVAEDGVMRPEIQSPTGIKISPSMNVDVDHLDFSIPVQGSHIRVIEIVPDQVVTGERIESIDTVASALKSDCKRDLLKIAVIERHHNSGNIGKGFIKGLGLKQGALASSVAHDSHNVIVVGTNDEDMHMVVKAIVNMGGGLAAACDGRILADLPLPVAGLMSMEPVHAVRQAMDDLLAVAQEMGSKLQDPFMTLSFMALPVIPSLKITDRGLVDVHQFKHVPLFV